MERADLGLLLAACVRSVVRIRLISSQIRGANPVDCEYVLRISAPDPEALAAADDRFLTILGRADPTIADVDRFLAFDSETAAAAYLSGLADYVRGILLKDGDPASGVTGTHHDYRDAFARALHALKDHARPLPQLLCGFMRLNLNDFSAWRRPTGSRRLDAANALLGAIADDEQPAVRPSLPDAGKLICPVDAGLDAVVRACGRLASAPRWSRSVELEAEAVLKQVGIDPLDRSKLLAALAATATRLGAEVDGMLRELEGDPTFGLWAERNLMKAGS